MNSYEETQDRNERKKCQGTLKGKIAKVTNKLRMQPKQTQVTG